MVDDLPQNELGRVLPQPNLNDSRRGKRSKPSKAVPAEEVLTTEDDLTSLESPSRSRRSRKSTISKATEEMSQQEESLSQASSSQNSSGRGKKSKIAKLILGIAESHTEEEASQCSSSQLGRGKRIKIPKLFTNEEMHPKIASKKASSKRRTTSTYISESESFTIPFEIPPPPPPPILISPVVDDEPAVNKEEAMEIEENVQEPAASPPKEEPTTVKDSRILDMLKTADYDIFQKSDVVGKLDFGSSESIIAKIDAIKMSQALKAEQSIRAILEKEREKREKTEMKKQEAARKKMEKDQKQQRQAVAKAAPKGSLLAGMNLKYTKRLLGDHDSSEDPEQNSLDSLFVTHSGRVVRNRNLYLKERYNDCLFLDDKNSEQQAKVADATYELPKHHATARKFAGKYNLPGPKPVVESSSEEVSEDEQEVVKATVPSTSQVIPTPEPRKIKKLKIVFNRYKIHLKNNKAIRDAFSMEQRFKLRESRLPLRSAFIAYELANAFFFGNYNVSILTIDKAKDKVIRSNSDEEVCVVDDLNSLLLEIETRDAVVKELPGSEVARDIRQIERKYGCYDETVNTLNMDTRLQEDTASALDKHKTSKVLQVIKDQLMSEYTYLGMDNSASTFHVFSRKHADFLMRHIAAYTTRTREDAQNIHNWLVKYLPDDFLGAYMNILRVAKTYGYKVTDIVKDIVEEDNVLTREVEINRCVKDFINVKAVDPWLKDAKDNMPHKLNNVAFLVVLPNISTRDYCPSTVAYQDLMETFVPGLVVTTKFVSLSFETQEPVSVAELMEHCTELVRRELVALIEERPDDHIVCVGWDVTNAIISRVLAETGGVTACINLAYTNKTGDGYRGDVEDEMVLLYCPQLYVVGESSTMFDLKFFNAIRRVMTCETGLVIIGNADPNLRVSTTTLLRERVTQSAVNLVICEVIKDFLVAVLPFEDISVKELRKIMQPTDIDMSYEVDPQLLKENHTIMYSAQAVKRAHVSKPSAKDISQAQKEENIVENIIKKQIHQPLIVHTMSSANPTHVSSVSVLPSTHNDPFHESAMNTSRKETLIESTISHRQQEELDDFLDHGGQNNFF
uniref:SANT domain-containing protein n=1 Tax=Rhabditophanes sp. KR3021 TaxID=114890 RepID=A0AC35TJZ6_9BILA